MFLNFSRWRMSSATLIGHFNSFICFLIRLWRHTPAPRNVYISKHLRVFVSVMNNGVNVADIKQQLCFSSAFFPPLNFKNSLWGSCIITFIWGFQNFSNMNWFPLYTYLKERRNLQITLAQFVETSWHTLHIWSDMGVRGSSLANSENVQICSYRIACSNSWTFKELPGNQNCCVKTKRHTSGPGSWHSFWERCMKLYIKRFSCTQLAQDSASPGLLAETVSSAVSVGC